MSSAFLSSSAVKASLSLLQEEEREREIGYNHELRNSRGRLQESGGERAKLTDEVAEWEFGDRKVGRWGISATGGELNFGTGAGERTVGRSQETEGTPGMEFWQVTVGRRSGNRHGMGELG